MRVVALIKQRRIYDYYLGGTLLLIKWVIDNLLKTFRDHKERLSKANVRAYHSIFE